MDIKIGRSVENDIVVPGNYSGVSNRHAKISLSNGLCVIQDLNSTNGTFVNGCRYASKQITATDVVTLGGCTLNDYKVDVAYIITSMQAGKVPSQDDYSEQFNDVVEVYTNYQNEVSGLVKSIRLKTLLPKTLIMIAFILIGLIGCIVANDVTYKIVFMSLGTIVGLVVQLVIKDRSVELQNGQAEIMAKYQPHYKCPKCGRQFPITTHWKILKTTGCSCGAKFQ